MRIRKIDANQNKIVKTLRQVPGVSVLSIAAIGHGCPDIMVGIYGNTYLYEIKDPKQPPSGRKLTVDEINFKAAWHGHYKVITTVQEILRDIRITK